MRIVLAMAVLVSARAACQTSAGGDHNAIPRDLISRWRLLQSRHGSREHRLTPIRGDFAAGDRSISVSSKTAGLHSTSLIFKVHGKEATAPVTKYRLVGSHNRSTLCASSPNGKREYPVAMYLCGDDLFLPVLIEHMLADAEARVVVPSPGGPVHPWWRDGIKPEAHMSVRERLAVKLIPRLSVTRMPARNALMELSRLSAEVDPDGISMNCIFDAPKEALANRISLELPPGNMYDAALRLVDEAGLDCFVGRNALVIRAKARANTKPVLPAQIQKQVTALTGNGAVPRAEFVGEWSGCKLTERLAELYHATGNPIRACPVEVVPFEKAFDLGSFGLDNVPWPEFLSYIAYITGGKVSVRDGAITIRGERETGDAMASAPASVATPPPLRLFFKVERHLNLEHFESLRHPKCRLTKQRLLKIYGPPKGDEFGSDFGTPSRPQWRPGLPRPVWPPSMGLLSDCMLFGFGELSSQVFDLRFPGQEKDDAKATKRRWRGMPGRAPPTPLDVESARLADGSLLHVKVKLNGQPLPAQLQWAASPLLQAPGRVGTGHFLFWAVNQWPPGNLPTGVLQIQASARFRLRYADGRTENITLLSALEEVEIASPELTAGDARHGVRSIMTWLSFLAESPDWAHCPNLLELAKTEMAEDPNRSSRWGRSNRFAQLLAEAAYAQKDYSTAYDSFLRAFDGHGEPLLFIPNKVLEEIRHCAKQTGRPDLTRDEEWLRTFRKRCPRY